MKNHRLINKKDIENNLSELRNIVFEVTDACNLNCKYCAYSDLYEGYDKRENLKFPFHCAKLIIDYLYHNYWKKKIGKGYKRTISISFYGGEPLLNVPFIKQVIEYLDQLPDIGISFRYSMTTNAMLLNRYMDYLVEKDFSLLISLDGDKKGQSYRIDRNGQNSFDKVYRNIQELRATYPSFFENKVNFNSVIHNRNSIESVYDFIKTEFGKIPRISPLSRTDIRQDKKEIFEKMYKNVIRDLESSCKYKIIEEELFVNAPRTAKLLDYIRHSSENIYQSYVHLILNKENIKYPLTATCIPFLRKMFITVTGKILQCEKISHDFSLGQITDNQVILNLGQVAAKHNKNTSIYLDECATCAIRNNCQKCVYMSSNPLRDIKCDRYTTQKELLEYKENTLRYLEERPELYEAILNRVIIRD